MLLGDLVSGSLQLFWPARCAGCDAVLPDDVLFCGGCDLSLLPLGVGACPGCALPREGDDVPGGGGGRQCFLCRRMPFAFDSAAAGFEYGEAVAAAIVRMKHGGRRYLGRRLARLLIRPLGEAMARGRFGPDDVVLPVPLHARRLRRRGFNQALELARYALGGLARAPALLPPEGLPRLEPALLRRTRDTRELGHAGPAARLAEVAGAFAVAEADAGRVRGRRFLLVDDVMTTGATFNECADVLRGAGARAVHVLALARAV
jgi:ComF family protein